MGGVLRFVFCLLGVVWWTCTCAQAIDSVHVYARVAPAAHTSASANALAWRLYREGAPHRVVKGADLHIVAEALAEYRPARHISGPLEELSHVAMAFSGGRPVAFGITDDLGCVINFTGRTEYRISTWAQHVEVRALLARLLVE
jgi:hypothetical protein